MRKVDEPLSMTMGVEDGKLAKSVCRDGRVSDGISPPAARAVAGGGRDGFGAFGVLSRRRPLRDSPRDLELKLLGKQIGREKVHVYQESPFRFI